MMESMTGYGESTVEGEKFLFSITARSVNHRYLDLSIRMPDFLRRHEREVAEVARRSIARGRLEVRVEATAIGEESRRVEIRRSVLRSYRDAIGAAQGEGLLAGEPTPGEMLRLPEVVQVVAEDPDSGAADVEALLQGCDGCVQALLSSRRREGRQLEASLRELLGQLTCQVEGLEGLREQLRDELAQRVGARLQMLAGEVEIEPDRLVAELAVLAERSDIQEELDRLEAHLASFASLLSASQAVGKKLDFLCQEILRELNTIGSKCRDTKAMPYILDGKVVCEQLREQVQNIQ